MLQQQHDYIVAGRLLPEFVSCLRRHGLALSRQHPARFLLRAYLRNLRHAVRHHAQENTRQPDRENAERVEDHSLLEVIHLLGGQAEDENVRKGYRRKRNKRVAEKVERRDAFAREQWRKRRRRQNRVRSTTKSAHAATDHDDGDRSESQKENGLKSIDPGGAAHAAEKDVAHDYESDDSAAKPVRNKSAADRIQRRAAAHDADDDVRHEQH